MGYSHMNFLGRIADTLVDAGHDVSVLVLVLSNMITQLVTLQPLVFPHVNNGTRKSRLIQVDTSGEFREEFEAIQKENPLWTASATSPLGVLSFLPMLKRITTKTLLRILDDKELLEQLKSEGFDVGIAELFDFTGIGVFEAIGLKNMVGAHSTSSMQEGTAFSIGLPVLPSFMPASLGVTDDSSSFLTRMTNILFTFLSCHFQTSIADSAEKVMMEKLGSNFTPIWDTVANMSWILSNVEPLLEYPKPTLHKVVDIGGMGVHKPKPLDEVTLYSTIRL
ncbi:hypothetical protein OESDEN_04614 [Oesophagostomum dentatum]|uniref:glucuronosyltransferase n=1 Tax=Oesophagostomum dentatum TaxID=61180 RepID=A0A0B1TCZ6_OESDE|nr:hypothetical protein OESDEN_04614 [Oesophagostomum dentatum]